MPDRYPGYDVLTKRDTPSWNEQTRRVIERRLALVEGAPRFLDATEYVTLRAVASRIVPQPADRPAIPVAALVDHKLSRDASDGYRDARLPPLRDAWRRGLQALDAAARQDYAIGFAQLAAAAQDDLLTRMQHGQLTGGTWGDMPCALFFREQMARDIVQAYYAHPSAWNEIGFGGPASPRGYVRMGFNRRDPWEGAEAHDGDVETARRENQRVG